MWFLHHSLGWSISAACCFRAHLQNCLLNSLCICGMLSLLHPPVPISCLTESLDGVSTGGQWCCFLRVPKATFAGTEWNKLCPYLEWICKTPVREGRSGNQLKSLAEARNKRKLWKSWPRWSEVIRKFNKSVFFSGRHPYPVQFWQR